MLELFARRITSILMEFVFISDTFKSKQRCGTAFVVCACACMKIYINIKLTNQFSRRTPFSRLSVYLLWVCVFVHNAKMLLLFSSTEWPKVKKFSGEFLLINITNTYVPPTVYNIVMHRVSHYTRLIIVSLHNLQIRPVL